jgi:ComF family protein
VRHALNALVRTFLEPGCRACHAPLEQPLDSPVCPACWRGVMRVVRPICARCGDALPAGNDTPFCSRCLQSPPRFERALSAGQHAGSLRAIVHAFKYGGCRPLAEPLAAMMRAAGSELLIDADAVVPVPLDPWRQIRRGFNQADDLARHIELPVWRVLRRRQRGPAQAALPAAQRKGNVRGAFVIRGRPLAIVVQSRRDQLRDRTVVLIDDVMTTGATLDACAAALVGAGVRTVRALTVARAVAILPPSPLERRDHAIVLRR